MRHSKPFPEIVAGVPFQVETHRFVREGLGIIQGMMTASPSLFPSDQKKDGDAATVEVWIMDRLTIKNVGRMDEKTQWRIFKALADEGYRILNRAKILRKG